MSSLNTNFNVSPYFDDYEEAKKYYRILFRPEMAVQARELTQAQTMQQKQIERFGNHIFKDGSVVEGCSATEYPNLDFVRVSDDFLSNNSWLTSDVKNDMVIVGATSNVRAIAIASSSGVLVNYPDTNRLYVKYLNTGANGVTTFANGETLSIYSSAQNKFANLVANNLVNTINVIAANSTVNAVGKGYGFGIENGIIYHKSFFQIIDDQVIVIRDYDQNVANYVVGFNTLEEIVNEVKDTSLLDNALGYPSNLAPGAHRLKLTPVLVAKDRNTVANNDNFFAVFEFSNISNSLVINKTKTPYDNLADIMGQRTYDESGDYVIKPFMTESIATTNSQSFAYQVSSGKGYVHGSSIEYLSSRSVETPRAITSTVSKNQIITANYGNYVYLKEYAGALDNSTFVLVDIYDQPMAAITNRFTPSLVGKNKVGTAKITSVLHFEGDPGTPATTYEAYISDIVMNSGKSFSNDAKSFVATSATNPLGNFYGDLVLQNSKAVINTNGKNSLVFSFGKKALKTLRSANGSINNTSFYFRASSNAVMATNGFITVTTTSSYAGGTDRLGYSTGVLGDSIEDQFNIVLAANVSTANIAGTINLNSTNTTIVTSGLNTYFANNEFIKLQSGAGIDFRRVVSVNATAMVIDAVPSATNTAANFAKHFPAGYAIPMDNGTYPGTRQVNVTSNTTFEVSTGAAAAAALTSTANVVVQYRMLRTQATQAKKDVAKERYVKLYANASANNSWDLGIPDVYNVRNVYANSSGFTINSSDDVTSYFTFDDGQRDMYYDTAKLVLKPQYAGQLGNKQLTVVLDHFSANLNNGIGFMSVDSYPIDDANTANTIAIQTSQIPTYGIIDLRDAVDFRAYKANTANSSTTLAGATLNPTASNTYVTNTLRYFAEPDTNFVSDIEYYLGRIDLVTLNSSGGLSVVNGTPSESPITPTSDTDAMVIATATVPPYPTLTTREAESLRRSDYTVKTSIATNRGYTMRDIGVLDKRIERIEYYTTLNMLEQSAQNVQVPDENGLNRFKNGIFADPMNSHINGNVSDIEYRWSIDSDAGYGRPLFSSENIDLYYDSASSTGVTATRNNVVLPYTEEKYIFQPFSTKYRNNTQDFWAWNGTLDLYPSYDMNRDETSLPATNATIDLTQPFMDFASAISNSTGTNVFGTRWGDWRTTDSRTTQLATGVSTFAVPVKNTIDIGKFVTDVSIQPYMKSRVVAFVARNLKPNTKIYGFFDDIAVSTYCAPAVLNTAYGSTLAQIVANAAATGKPEDALIRTAAYGTQLVSDATGNLYGVFFIPANKFRTGDRNLQFSDVPDLTTGADGTLTSASATFTASNIAITTKNATVTTVTPSIQQTVVTDTRSVVSTSTSSVTAFVRQEGSGGGGNGRGDPIAQSFYIDAPTDQSGVYVTSLNLFFQAKDPNLGLTVYLVGMSGGNPDSSTVYGKAYLPSASINVSNTAAVATTFTFNNPIYLSSSKEYAFYVAPDGNSPEFRMWMAETGGFDVITASQVYKNPYTGDAFRSSNSSSWTVIPKEDVKFDLFVANFTVGTGTVVFNNEDDEFFTYSGLATANASAPLAVGQEVYVINSVSNVAIANTARKAFVQSFDTSNSKIRLDSSTGGFANGQVIGIFQLPQQGNTAQANTTTLIATATIESVDNPSLCTIVPRFAIGNPSGTSVTLSFSGTSTSGVRDGGYYDVTLDDDREMLDYERSVFSKSNAVAAGLTSSLNIKAVLTNSNKYLSPSIDLSRKSALVIRNIINNDNTNEHTRYGNAIAKYISKPIVLDEGQDSEDLRVYLTAYRPINTEVEVYVKFLNSQDSTSIDTKVWTKLENNNPGLRSSPIDSVDWKEFVYDVPSVAPITNAAYKNASNFNILEYTDSSGAIYRSYKTFAIKIVLLSTSRIYVPKINDIRGIALQV